MQRAPEINPASQKSHFSYVPAPVLRAEHGENSVTRLIEQQTAKIPSDYFLFTALASMAISLALELSGRTRGSRFIGMWVSPLLVLGIYNKLVKILGPR